MGDGSEGKATSGGGDSGGARRASDTVKKTGEAVGDSAKKAGETVGDSARKTTVRQARAMLTVPGKATPAGAAIGAADKAKAASDKAGDVAKASATRSAEAAKKAGESATAAAKGVGARAEAVGSRVKETPAPTQGSELRRSQRLLSVPDARMGEARQPVGEIAPGAQADAARRASIIETLGGQRADEGAGHPKQGLKESLNPMVTREELDAKVKRETFSDIKTRFEAHPKFEQTRQWYNDQNTPQEWKDDLRNRFEKYYKEEQVNRTVGEIGKFGVGVEQGTLADMNTEDRLDTLLTTLTTLENHPLKGAGGDARMLKNISFHDNTAWTEKDVLGDYHPMTHEMRINTSIMAEPCGRDFWAGDSWGKYALYESGAKDARREKWLAPTLDHECAHALEQADKGAFAKWGSYFYRSGETTTHVPEGISGYGTENVHEDFAESVAFVVGEARGARWGSALKYSLDDSRKRFSEIAPDRFIATLDVVPELRSRFEPDVIQRARMQCRIPALRDLGWLRA